MKQIYVISLIVAVVFLGVGYLIGANNIFSPVASGPNTFQAGWDAAKKRLVDYGFAPALVAEVKNLSGSVQSVSGNNITIKIRPLEPLADPNLDERIVETDSNTKIYLLEQKNYATYKKELDAYSQKTASQVANLPKIAPLSTSSLIAPPEQFIKKTASVSDIKAGYTIDVAAATDIKNAKNFTAVEIEIQPALNQAPAPIIFPSAP